MTALSKQLNILLSDAQKEHLEYKKVDNKEFTEMISTNYSEGAKWLFDEDVPIIIRGMKSIDASISIITPKYRISKGTTSNLYTRLFSEILPSWSSYPKRNHSFIASNNACVAANYGKAYYIIPANGTKLGICPMNDIWESFEESGISSLNYFNAIIDSIYANIPNPVNIHELSYNGSKKEIIEALNIINAENVNEYLNFKDARWIEIVKEMFKLNPKFTFVDCLEQLFNPDKNNFKTLSIEEYSKDKSYLRGRNEIWFDNTAIFIKEEFANNNLIEIIKEMRHND